MVNTYHYRRGGADVHAIDLAEELRRAGHDVRFFAMHHPENLASPDSEYWVPEIDYPTMNASKTPANAARVLSRAIYSVPARRAIARMLDDWRPDVAHLHNIHVHLTPSIVDELKARGIPVVWTLHDYKFICPNQGFICNDEVCERCKGQRFWQCTMHKCKRGSRAASLVGTLEAEAHRFLHLPERVDAFIAPSEFLRRKFIEYGWPAAKTIHMPNFNNVALVPEAVMPEGRRVLYAGQVLKSKGVLTLLESLRRSPGVRLDVAGEGPARDRVDEIVRSGDWAGAAVHTHGRVGPDVLRGLIDAARVVAVPSEWYENGPYAVIEAFSRARPVIGTRIGGIPELVVDGVSGILVEPRSPDEISAAVDRLLEDDDLWRRLATGARRVAGERDAGAYVAELEALYATVTGGTRA
jgi:glycosyltransferase involved in cell wall biosynthesis